MDSERILSKLRAKGYELSGEYVGVDLVVVQNCGFLDTAKAESLDAIGEATQENGRVSVIGIAASKRMSSGKLTRASWW